MKKFYNVRAKKKWWYLLWLDRWAMIEAIEQKKIIKIVGKNNNMLI